MSNKTPKAPTEVQPDLFPNLPKVPPVPTEAITYDPMNAPGQEMFPGWDPLGTEKFHGPASD